MTLSPVKIAALLQSPDMDTRLRGYALASAVSSALVVKMFITLDSLPRPTDPLEAALYSATSSRLTRGCFMTSPLSAKTHARRMSDSTRAMITELLLETADGSPREGEFLDVLLPEYVARHGHEVLARTHHPSARARVFAHLIEWECSSHKGERPSLTRLSLEPIEVVLLVRAITKSRRHSRHQASGYEYGLL